MKETIKAAIGGYAFTLDTDAYEILKSYLNDLKLHFANKEDGKEIIADIEARMCELLQMKAGKPERIITLEDANSIIDIMGNPVEFEEEEAKNVNNNTQAEKPESAPIRKRLYRDTENGVLGGVCAGLAKYFQLDPVVVRVGYVALIALGGLLINKLGGWLFLSYFLLWIAMPKAKTMAQKLAMSGQDPSVEAIENRTAKVTRRRGSHVGSTLGSIIKAVIGTIVFMLGIVIALGGGFAIFFPAALDLPTITELLTIFGLNSGNIHITLAVLWFLPAICLIYLAIVIYTKVTPKDFVIFGIAFIIWVGATTYFGINTAGQMKNYRENANITEKVDINTPSDTLYVKLHHDLNNAYNWGKKRSELYTLDGNPKSWFLFPKVHVNKDTIYKNFEVKIKKIAFDRTYRGAEAKAANAKLDYTVQDSLLIVKPHLYNSLNPWNREIFAIEINCPANKTVILNEPIHSRHNFFNTWEID